MIDALEKAKGYVEILPDRVTVWEPTEISPRNWVAMVAYETSASAGSGNCAGAAAIVTASSAKTGMGPLAYDVAIELTGGLGLMPDRFTVSDSAKAVWSYYYNNRPDVETVQTDNFDNQLTPEEEDNCVQRSSLRDKGQENFNQSVLSKVYKKSDTPVMDELRKRGMLT